MLSKLHIKNYALIDNLDISFDQGLNMITGETGAGKSILMGALGLILGNRAEGKQFFDDSRKCVVEGYFDVGSYRLQDFFAAHDLDYDQETIIRRELSIDGKSRAFVNDSPVNLNVLKSLGEKLVDIHSQHATLQVNTTEFQLLVLDSLAQNAAILDDFRASLKVLRRLEKRLVELNDEIQKANAEQDYNQFLFDELHTVNVQPGEIAALESEQQQLEHAEEIKRSLLAANFSLVDNEYNALEMLKEAVQQLRNASKYLSQVDGLAERLESAHIEIKDISDDIAQLESGVGLDEKRLDEINTRLSNIYTLLKKHRMDSEEELINLKATLEDKLQMALQQDEILDKLTKEYDQQKERTLVLADQLHESRKTVVPHIEDDVEKTLTHVGMGNAQLKINLVKEDFSKINGSGLDSVQFLFSANKGQALQPIHKVASGGELSRVMLAIKSLVAKSSALPTIIFDEIDTGISGEVALRVGEVMADLSTNMQVIAISHLPQIASRGQAHFKVYKEDKDDKTRSNILLLNEEERVLEIAQMLSGANPGEAALQHAKELLGG
jgi:DNA repair protein RecN (Recombination protein N)